MRLRFHFLLILLVAAPCLHSDARSDQEKRLRQVLKERILIIRGFYTGDKLRYSSTGELSGPGGPADWTRSQMEVEKVKLSETEIAIDGHRVQAIYDESQHELISTPQSNNKITVDIQLDPSASSDDQILALIGKIFLTNKDNLQDLVSDPWKTILQEHQKANTIIGGEIYKPGTAGIKPPAILQPMRQPEYSEEARRARYEGTAVLSLVVDVDGLPKDIRIVRSVGHGLDAEALRAVKQWRFTPGAKDGRSVPTQLNVEVAFRLRY